MTLKEMVLKNRSYRRFFQEKKITTDQLKSLIEVARLTPSAANRQPYKFKLICDEKMNENIYSCVKWAGYLKDWEGPKEGERPTGYIVMAAPNEVSAECDAGILGQTILLAAVEMGLGGCFMGSIDREQIAKWIGLSSEYKVVYVLALGYPKEEIVIEDIHADDDIKYYRDENEVHHVPKKMLEDILL